MEGSSPGDNQFLQEHHTARGHSFDAKQCLAISHEDNPGRGFTKDPAHQSPYHTVLFTLLEGRAQRFRHIQRVDVARIAFVVDEDCRG
eukprot:scaffold3841_cov412-Prasinococcus_capsulatus_cf.AAC.3